MIAEEIERRRKGLTSKAKIRANNKYNEKNYKQVGARVSPELASRFTEKCRQQGKSVRSVLIKLMEEYCES